MTEASASIEVNPAEHLPPWVRRVADLGSAAEDSAEERLRKRMLMLVVLLSNFIITGVLLVTIGFGDPRSALVPACYGLVTVIGVAHLVRTRKAAVLRYSQLLMILLLPAVQQWLLGGFVASAGSILYSMNAALLAVVLVGARAARWWLAAFAAIVVMSGLLDGWLTRTVIPPDVPIVLFFVVTITTVGILAWLPLVYFVQARRRLVLALDEANQALEREQQRSESLLLNILPERIASRLKDGEHPIADGFDHVAVLFADIVDFTPTTAAMSAREVIADLDAVFTRFDRLASSLGLEKVKTIGDAYMVVAGAPIPTADSADRLAEMALRMQSAAQQMTLGGCQLRLRIGMDVGPLVAGVIGENKFAWDVYGDVVNTASRMESHGLPDRVHLTERFRSHLSAQYGCQDRGPVEIKGKGSLRTFLLDPRTPPHSTESFTPSPG